MCGEFEKTQHEERSVFFRQILLISAIATDLECITKRGARGVNLRCNKKTRGNFEEMQGAPL